MKTTTEALLGMLKQGWQVTFTPSVPDLQGGVEGHYFRVRAEKGDQAAHVNVWVSDEGRGLDPELVYVFDDLRRGLERKGLLG